MKVIPRISLSRYNGELGDIFKCFINGSLIDGVSVIEFEEKFAAYINRKFAAALSSGRASLRLILEVLSLPKRSEIIISAYTDESVPRTVLECGFTPVFVDINNNDYNIDSRKIREKVNKNTKAIILTHLFGKPCSIKEITKIADDYNLIVIEDCAQALGVEYDGRKLGSFGLVAYFSFGITKPFNTLGGGMILTDDEKLNNKIKERVKNLPTTKKVDLLKNLAISLIVYIFTRPLCFVLFVYPLLLLLSIIHTDILGNTGLQFENKVLAKNKPAKISNLQALLGIRQLQYLDSNNKIRFFNNLKLDNLLHKDVYKNNIDRENLVSSYRYVTKAKDRKRLIRRLLLKGVDVDKDLGSYCPALINLKEEYPVALDTYKTILSLPNHLSLTSEDIEYVAQVFRKLQTYHD